MCYIDFAQKSQNLLMYFLLLLLLNDCSHEIPLDYNSNSNILINGGFETGTLANWGIEAARPNSVEITTKNVYAGRYAVKLTLYDGDKVYGGRRVELKRFNIAEDGQENVYSWEFMIPTDYIDDDRLQIIHQFHDWPNYRKGETWADIPGPPPVYTRLRNDTCYVKINTISHGHKTIGQCKITKGKWFEIRYQAKWSTQADGYLLVHFNGIPVTPFNGTDHKFYMPTLYNEEGNYLKIGLYTDPDITARNSVYLDDVQVIPLNHHL